MKISMVPSRCCFGLLMAVVTLCNTGCRSSNRVSQLPGMGWLSRNDSGPYADEWAEAERGPKPPSADATPAPTSGPATAAKKGGTKEKLASYEGASEYPDTGFPKTPRPDAVQVAPSSKTKKGFFTGLYNTIGGSENKSTEPATANPSDAHSASAAGPTNYAEALNQAAHGYTNAATQQVKGATDQVSNTAQQVGNTTKQYTDAAQKYIESATQQYTQAGQQYATTADQQGSQYVESAQQVANQAAANLANPTSGIQPYGGPLLPSSAPPTDAGNQNYAPNGYGNAGAYANPGSTGQYSGEPTTNSPPATSAPAAVSEPPAAPGYSVPGPHMPSSGANDGNWQSPGTATQSEPPGTQVTPPAPPRNRSPWRPFSTGAPVS